MTAFKVPLKIDQGSDFMKSVIWSGGKPPIPVDLSGCKAIGQIRPSVESATVLHEMSTENGGITVDGPAGMVTLLIPHTVTEGAAWRSGVYDLELIYPSGGRKRLCYGTVTMTPEVTRD